MIVAERIKAARNECKLTQQQVADILGIDRSTYSYYETGTNKPSVEILVRLSVIYNAELEWLAGADKVTDCFNDSCQSLSLLGAVKERKMCELSKNERKLVAVYRAASVIDKDKDIIELLMNILTSDSDEE